tara:strand:- start:161 stop:481 length:321 start_codon:yes stop_codon:yes gene_type:complete
MESPYSQWRATFDMANPDYSKLPLALQYGMKRYLENGSPTGDFLNAVLSNDLLGAVSRADDKNVKLLPEIVRWMHWEIPSNAWGSQEKVKSWEDSFKPLSERQTLG